MAETNQLNYGWLDDLSNPHPDGKAPESRRQSTRDPTPQHPRADGRDRVFYNSG